jgi:uncharacterized protein (DUF427 family)
MRATWNGAVLAESDDAELVEGNHYLPLDTVDRQYLSDIGTLEPRTSGRWRAVWHTRYQVPGHR